MLISESINKLFALILICSHKYFFLVFVGLILFTGIYNGIGLEPAPTYYLQAKNPFTEAKIHGFNPWQESLLLPLIAFYLHLNTKTSFLLLSFGISLIGLFLLALKTKKNFPPEIALILIMLSFSHPMVLFMYSWPGMPDYLTFIFAVLLLFTQSYPLVIVLSFLGGFNHPMVLLLFPCIFILRKIAREKNITWYYVPVIIAFTAAGMLAVQLFLKFNHIEITSRLYCILKNPFAHWFKHNLYNLPHALFSFQNMVWVALAFCIISVFARHRAYFYTFFVMQILFYLPTFVSLDTTRVFAVLTWAPTFHCITYSLKLARNEDSDICYKQLMKALCIIAIFGLMLPKYYYVMEGCWPYSFTEFYFPIFRSIQHFLFS